MDAATIFIAALHQAAIHLIAETRGLNVLHATSPIGEATARDWYQLARRLERDGITLTADDAALWAHSGLWPFDAEPHIRGGLTARQYYEISIGMTDPRRVSRTPDPDNPTREIITLRDLP